MGRTSAQLVLLWLGVSGCLLPPDGTTVEVPGPYPPQIDLTEVFPKAPRLQVDADEAVCSFRPPRLDVSGVKDLDSGQLIFRWVANNDLQNTTLLDDGISGAPHVFRQRVTRSAAFPNLPNGRTGIVSLFISDAAEWAVEDPVLTGEPADLGRIAPNPDAHVVEVRWAFEYIEGLGTCGE